MSKLYLETFGNEKVDRESLRAFLRPSFPRNKDGSPQYLTEQSHRSACDVNLIISKYDKGGLITHINRFEAKFGNFTGVDFKTMQDTISGIHSQFALLPSEIRKRFDNSPEALLTFMQNPENREEAIKLGLIDKSSLPESDGLGEHVIDGKVQQSAAGGDGGSSGGASGDDSKTE